MQDQLLAQRNSSFAHFGEGQVEGSSDWSWLIFVVTFETLATLTSNRATDEAGNVHAKKNDSIVSSAVEGRLENACVIISLFRPVDETIVVIACDAVSLRHPGTYQRKSLWIAKPTIEFPVQ